MPFAPPHPCNHPGCRELTTERYCPAHTKQVRKQAESRRTRPHGGSVYGRRWRERSKAYLRRNPLCVDPYGFHQGRPVPADCVDHIIPHKGDMTLFWDENNWQSMCSAPCHSYKTAHEDGGFGNARKMPKGEGGSNLQSF